jgi:pyruvate dehydrogenase E1 component beta subunit
MPVIAMREALRQAMAEEMRRDPAVFLMGEEVAQYDGAYKVSQGMLEEFGPERIVDTPIAENGFAGLGIGAAMAGMRPIIEFMTWNFSLVAYDQIINNAARIYQMSAGQYKVPIVFRGANGHAENLASQHSTSVESLYAHFPGLKVVSPATPYDAKGMLKTAIRDDNPVIFLESELMYALKGEVPAEEYLIPLGVADLKRDGKDVALITWGKPVFTCLKAAELLEKQGVDALVLDLRSLRPLDHDAIFNAVAKTHHAVVVQEGFAFAGVGAEIVARIMESCFDLLDAAVLRVTNRDLPQPYATNLEKLVVITPERVAEAALATLGRK